MLSSEYMSWAKVLWDYYYGIKDARSPVYLDLDEQDLEELQSLLPGNLDSTALREALVSAVRENIVWGNPRKQLLTKITSATRSWFDKAQKVDVMELEPAPQLPFLAVTVLAASEMGSGDFNPNAYYPVLAKVFQVDDAEGKLSVSYQEDIEFLWKSLNQTLERFGGVRGLPTATALSHRFVSIPASQSTIKESDRQKLIEFFLDAQFEPHASVSTDEITELFGEWISKSTNQVSTALMRNWERKGTSKTRVAEVISQELLLWDGSLGRSLQDDENISGEVLVVLRRDFDWTGKASLSFSLAIKSASLASLGKDRFDAVDLETQAKVTLTRMNDSSFFSLAFPGDTSPDALLYASYRIEVEQKHIFERQPRGLVLLSNNSTVSAMTEVDSLSLGQPISILVENAGRLRGLLLGVLHTHADESFSLIDSGSAGLSNWDLFMNVRIHRSIQDTDLPDEMLSLKPKSILGVKPSGGISLRDYFGQRLWSYHRPPLVSSISADGSSLRIEISNEALDEPDEKPIIREFDDGIAELDLGDLHLSDGDYSVALYVGTAKTPKSRLGIKLRSRDNPRSHLNRSFESLGYSPQVPSLGALRTAEGDVFDGFPDATSFDIVKTELPIPTKSFFWGSGGSDATPKEELFQPKLGDLQSCRFTLAHHWNLPTAHPGIKRKTEVGKCFGCGALKSFPGNHKGALRKETQHQAPIKPNLDLQIMAVPVEFEIDWKGVLPSLQYLGNGDVHEIKLSLSQLEIDAISLRNYLRWQEAAGNIEFENQFDDAAQWQFVSPYLARTAHDNWRLLGSWTSNLEKSFEESSFEIFHLSHEYGEQAFCKTDRDSGLYEWAKSNNVKVYDTPWLNLMSFIEPLAHVMDNLKFEKLPYSSRVERFDVFSASWMEVEESVVAEAGAFRFRNGLGWQIFFVTDASATEGRGARVDSFSAKHLAAARVGKPLISYDSDTGDLAVPLGAELPGLLGRLATSFAGMPPIRSKIELESEKITVVVYKNVTADAAAFIYHRLGGT